MEPRDTAKPVTDHPIGVVYAVDDLIVDTGRAMVTRDDRELALPKLSFDLLVALIEAGPRVVSQDELMDRVWAGLVVGPETVIQRVKLLRDSLDDDPKSPRYVAGVRGRGYRLIPPVHRVGEPAMPAVGTSARSWKPLVLTAVVAIIAAAGVWLLMDRERADGSARELLTDAPLPARSVAVLAFENRGGAPGNDILAEGIPETVLHQLARLPGVTVIARGSSFAFQDKPVDLRVIGRRLNVRYLLEGSVQTAGRRLRVTSSLVDAQTGASVWSMQFDRAPEDIFAMQDEIAVEVARAMQLTLAAGTDAVAALRQDATRSYEAYVAFLRGRALLESERVAELPAAIESLSAAIRHDPGFASAYVLLARAQVALAAQQASAAPRSQFLHAIEDASHLLSKAIELDPGSGEAYVERGWLKAFVDVAAADTDLRRGLELAPNYARGYEGLAAVLFQSAARRGEALAMIEKARRLDPLELRLDVIKAAYLYYGPGDSGQATAILQSVLDRDPLYVPALVRLGTLRWTLRGQHAESVQIVEQAVALDPGNETAWRQLAASYLDMDEVDAAEQAFDRIQADPPLGWLSLHLYRKDWRKAGEAAYAMIAAGDTLPYDERRIALAIRMHARATGDMARAIRTLETWANVEWEGDDALLHGQLDEGMAVAGLADLLSISGQRARARTLAQAILSDSDAQMARYGRGEIWLNDGRAMAQVLLERPDDAVATMKRQLAAGVIYHEWRFMLIDEPLFEGLRQRADFQALVADTRAVVERERLQLAQLRKDGLVPVR